MAATYTISTRNPWPARAGHTATIIEPTPEQANEYPYTHLHPADAVIHIDNDPLRHHTHDRPWSCVMPRCYLDEQRCGRCGTPLDDTDPAITTLGPRCADCWHA